jgi:hypothetical protein
MSDRPTPETDELMSFREGFGATNYEWALHSRRLERERDEARKTAERYRLEANAMMLQRDEAISKL